MNTLIPHRKRLASPGIYEIVQAGTGLQCYGAELRIVSWLGIGTTVHRCGDMHTKQHSGFTLVELAVVVFLVGLMASVGLAALNAQMTSASISATKKKQEIIKDALIAYLGTNKRLPCPAIVKSDGTIDGNESRVTTNAPAFCTLTAGTGSFGILPYATLGLSKSTALDGQENFFSYAVSKQWTLTYSTAADVVGGTSTNTAGNAFNVGITGTILVNGRAASTGNPIIPISSSTTGGPAAVFIISHGKNGLGAVTSKGTQNAPPAGTDELANVPNKTTWALPASSTFYQREYTDNATAYGAYGAFDDVALTLNPNDLITPLVKDGALKSAEAQWAEQIAIINNTLIGDMFLRSRCSPLGNQQNSISESAAVQQSRFVSLMQANGIPLVDPWGGTLRYTAGDFCRLHDDGKYKTSDCSNDCGSGTCYFTSIPIFTITTTTTTPPVTIKTQMLNTVIAANSSLTRGCPSP